MNARYSPFSPIHSLNWPKEDFTPQFCNRLFQTTLIKLLHSELGILPKDSSQLIHISNICHFQFSLHLGIATHVRTVSFIIRATRLNIYFTSRSISLRTYRPSPSSSLARRSNQVSSYFSRCSFRWNKNGDI